MGVKPTPRTLAQLLIVALVPNGCSARAAAQTITANPHIADAGSSLEIRLTAFPPGTTIELELDNGDGERGTATVRIDSDGNGSTTWTIPDSGWDLVNINVSTTAGHANEETVAVRH